MSSVAATGLDCDAEGAGDGRRLPPATTGAPVLELVGDGGYVAGLST